ncbi:MAG: acyltransferase family protein [Actinomycetota bacterium]|nr:acyltransferase family protein [Actinomycetota bacterium]
MTNQGNTQEDLRDLLPREVPERLPYMPGIDGLRAIAVVAVILYHAEFGFIPGGFLGVEVFLVISGYLITSLLILERARTGTIDLKEFWTRRARRLLPALTVLLFLTVTSALLFARDALFRLNQDVLGALTYSTNWMMIFRQESYFEAFARPPLLRHLWSLAVEEQFYVFFPLIFAGGMLLLSRRSTGYGQTARRFMGVAAVGVIASTALMWLLYVPYEDPSRVYFGTDTRAAGLLIGVALAFAWQPWRFRKSLARRGTIILNVIGFTALGFLTFILLTIGEYDLFLYRGGFLLVSILTGLVIAVTVHPQGALNPVLGNRPLVWIGKRSYGLYLYHWPVFVLMRPGIDVPWGRWPTLVAQVAVTVALTEASYRWIEQPIRRRGFKPWIAWVTEPLRRRSPQAAALWPLIAGVFVIGLTIGLVQGSSIPPPGQEIAASPVEPPPATDETLPTDSTMATTTIPDTTVPDTTIPDTPVRDTTIPDTTVPAPPTVIPPPVMIGDSVMLGARVGLEKAVEDARVNGSVSRQMKHVPSVITQLRAEEPFGDIVVVHLGTNGPFNSAHFDDVMVSLADVDHVYFVNASVPRRYEGSVNNTLAAGVERWDRAYLIDWRNAAKDHSEYFVKDGVHLTSAGIDAYSALIAGAINR